MFCLYGTPLSVKNNQNIFTVSRLNSEVRLLLENEMGIIWLVGEVSNFSTPVSGHWYFSLKDARAQVKCAMFRGNNRHVTFKPENGNQVLVKARLSLYEPRGDYQLIIESMQPEGDGKLSQEFEKLKMQLAAEGLFAQSLKKPLPKNPTRIGIITSKTGAALYDILDVLKRRDPGLAVVIYPTMVQGESAAFEIAQAIGRANSRNECDVLIVGRGGGSLEDLWCFNHEIVARTIAASQIPIVSAVGHEIDVTISDFVADVRVPTPSAAAELVSRDHSHREQALQARKVRLVNIVKSYLSQNIYLLHHTTHQLEKQHPSYQLERQAQKFDELEARLTTATIKQLHSANYRQQNISHKLQLASPDKKINQQRYIVAQLKQKLKETINKKLITSKHHLAIQAEKLDTVSPLATLKRGYSITTDKNDKVILQASEIKKGDHITTRFADGEVQSTVI